MFLIHCISVITKALLLQGCILQLPLKYQTNTHWPMWHYGNAAFTRISFLLSLPQVCSWALTCSYPAQLWEGVYQLEKSASSRWWHKLSKTKSQGFLSVLIPDFTPWPYLFCIYRLFCHLTNKSKPLLHIKASSFECEQYNLFEHEIRHC